MLNCPDGKIIKLYVDDEPFDLETAELVSFNRRLEMREGTLRREIVFRTPTGKRIRLASCRLVSFHHRHLAAIRYEVVAEDAGRTWSSRPRRSTGSPCPFRPRSAHGGGLRRRAPPGGRVAEGRAILSFTTSSSGSRSAAAWSTRSKPGAPSRPTCAARTISRQPCSRFGASRQAGPDPEVPQLPLRRGTTPREIRARTAWTLDRAEEGFDTVLERQQAYVAAFWERADVEVEGGAAPEKQQVIRWNLFQLLQASARAEARHRRPWTDRTDLRGPLLWDTEVYVLPFLIYTNPPMARSILKFRYDQLDKRAGPRARHAGATFPGGR